MIAIFVLAQKSVSIAETVKNMLLESGFDSELVCSENLSCNSADENVKSVYSAIRERFRAKRGHCCYSAYGYSCAGDRTDEKDRRPLGGLYRGERQICYSCVERA